MWQSLWVSHTYIELIDNKEKYANIFIYTQCKFTYYIVAYFYGIW